MKCPACSAAAPEGARFCPSCAAPLEASPDAPTAMAPEQGFPTPSSGGSGISHPSAASPVEGGRFLPGTLIAGRYRMVGLLGRGGMGEVYRADDLKLGQPVALKFLPAAAARDPEWLERFLTEVKIARQISHPSVCRVYDVGEVTGRHFLSMEYIDGEDLSSLLRRIGRLPEAKAVQIARQICAGLAAAHEQGVLHRDLKPANVMVDGRGNAKITDFGLAGLAEAIATEDVSSGTPAYMAPEQLAGREVTAKSDLYSLGLVLYQLFTGKPAFEADSAEEMRRLREESSPTRPTDLVEGLDPAIERAVLRCLDRDPRQRPASALAVSAALPGGDPLAAALAAGETPSPEMVAAAGEEGILSPKAALVLIGAFALLAALFLGLAVRTQITSVIPLDRPREVLLDRALELLRELGVDPREAADRAHGIRSDRDVLRWLEREVPPAETWEMLGRGRPAAVQFWYRQSPRAMVPMRNIPSQVSWGEPPYELSGMAAVRLDTEGRLIELLLVPPQLEEEGEQDAALPEPGWERLFRAAALPVDSLTPVEPRWVPPVFSDRRSAWTGPLPESPELEVRVEAASYRGRPVYFRVLGPWSRAERQVVFESSARGRIGQIVTVVVVILLLGSGAWIARRHLKSGRGDARGAFRLALAIFLLHALAWLLGGHHPGGLTQEFGLFVLAASWGLFMATAAWALYIALEPYVRRYRPEGVIAWSRLVSGRIRDPLVGRDILIGAVGGAVVAVLSLGNVLVERWVGRAAGLPSMVFTEALESPVSTLGSFVYSLPGSLFGAMFLIFFWFLMRQLLPWRWLAGVLFLAVLTLNFSAGDDFSWAAILFSALIVAVFLLMLARFGLVAMISALLFSTGISNMPIPVPASAWYGRGSWIVLLLLAAFALWAFRTALGGRKVLSGALLE